MPSKQTNDTKQPFILVLFQLFFKAIGNVAPKLVGNIAYKLWFKPSRFKMPDREADAVRQARISSIATDSGSIRTWSWGHGPTILFMHGWSGRGTQVSGFVQPLVKAGYRVVSFDGPAHGESDGNKTDIIKYAAVTKKIIEHFGPLHGVITHSFGAMVFCLAYEEAMPLNKAVFICAPATLATPITHFETLLNIPKPALDIFVRNLWRDYGEHIYGNVSILDNLKKIKAPLMVIHDDEDAVVNWQDGEQIANAKENSRFIKTSGLGHRRLLNDETVINAVRAFI